MQTIKWIEKFHLTIFQANGNQVNIRQQLDQK